MAVFLIAIAIMLGGCSNPKLDESKVESFIQNELNSSLNTGFWRITKSEDEKWQATYVLETDELVISGENYIFVQSKDRCSYYDGENYFQYPGKIDAMHSLIDHKDVPDIFGLEEGFKKAKVKQVEYNSEEKCFDVDFSFLLDMHIFQSKIKVAENEDQLSLVDSSFTCSSDHYTIDLVNGPASIDINDEECVEVDGVEIRNALYHLGNYEKATNTYQDFINNTFYYSDFYDLKDQWGFD